MKGVQIGLQTERKFMLRSERLLDQTTSNKKVNIMIYHNVITHISKLLFHSTHTTIAKSRGPNPCG